MFADDTTLRGAKPASSDAFNRATTGESAIVDIVDVGASDAAGAALPTATVLREYFPLSLDGQVVGVVGVWRDAVPILAQLDEVRRNIVIVTLSAALVAAFVLFLVFRSAQGRITRQTQGARRVDAARSADPYPEPRRPRRRGRPGGRSGTRG